MSMPESPKTPAETPPPGNSRSEHEVSLHAVLEFFKKGKISFSLAAVLLGVVSVGSGIGALAAAWSFNKEKIESATRSEVDSLRKDLIQDMRTENKALIE